MKSKKLAAGLAVLAAGALVLTACAGGTTPGDNNGNGSTTAPEVPELAAVAYEVLPGDQVADGGTLNLAVLSTPTNEGSWNPNHARSQEVYTQRILEPTLGKLGWADEGGAVVPNPAYASSVEIVSESPQTVEVILNGDAVWEDGSAITADDWKATIDAAGNVEGGYEVIPSSIYSAIDEVTVVSPTEFTVTFSEVFADWQTLMLIPVLPTAIATDVEDFNTGYTDKPIPSAGPFVFDSVDNAASIFTLVPNPNWWGDAPKLELLTFKNIAQEALPQAYANDEIDFLEIATPDALAIAESKAGAEIQRSGGLTWAHVTFNLKNAPFDDANVRKAVASAIDRELIARVANDPLGAPAATLGDWIFMPGQDGYIDAFGEVYQRDEAQVAEYLEAAGYAKGDDGFWAKDGARLSFEIIVPAGTQSNINRALGVQDALAEFGIEVNLDQSPSEEYFINISEGRYQAATFGWQGTPFPISSSETIYYPDQEFGDQTGQNYSFGTDERLKPLFDQANAELDVDARLAIANEISRVIADYVPSVPIYPYPEVGAADEGLVNYGQATFKSTDWSIVGYKK